MEWRQDDLDQMKRIERDVLKVLLPHAAQTEAGLAAIALVRQARTLIRKYPDATTREQLTRVVVDFLEGKTSPRDARHSGIIWSPS